MSIKLGLHTGPQEIAMAELKRLWKEGDEGGLHWISVWDHFYANPIEESKEPCFEGVAAMAALAALTKNVRVGCLVFCTLFRSPGLLAKAAVTIDHLSDGRAELGMGAGWFQEEFEDFGYAFPPIGERLDQLEEGLQVVRSLLRDDETNFDGRYYKLSNAVCTPKPVQKNLRIWVGGRGPKRTPRLAATYADGFNVPYLAPEAFKEHNQVVTANCEKSGRDPGEIERTINVGFYMGADEQAAERNKKGMDRFDPLRRTGMLSGTTAEVIDRIGEYEKAGAQGLNVAIRPPVDWDAYHAYLEEVVPRFHT
ncbi:MAG: TIGR03560 family F420-dependent LLM class oxidoreductase [SAR324 cluster bacterium]|nr:TIGR03560 family F420-dependent LLM class oxidoreductase [SAR324 cluster bacterium]